MNRKYQVVMLVFSLALTQLCYANVVIQPVTDVDHTHLAATAVQVINQGNEAVTLKNIDIAIPLGAQNKIIFCSADQKSCSYVSTCIANKTALQANNSCYIWLEAKSTDGLVAKTKITVPITIHLNSGEAVSKDLQLNYANLLYAGGEFDKTKDGMQVNYIAKWDGNIWSALTTNRGIIGVDDRVLALTLHRSDLYVGGQFKTAGENAVNGVVKWNGVNWLNLGDGVRGGPLLKAGSVFSLASAGGDLLYVGGRFEMVGGNTEAINIAQWDSLQQQWFAIKPDYGTRYRLGLRGYGVYALAFNSPSLFAGGDFIHPYNVWKYNFVEWNAEQKDWVVVTGDSCLDDSIFALVASDSKVYVGGDFIGSLYPEQAFNHIVKWKIDQQHGDWELLDQGLNGSVYILAQNGDDLFVGGSFAATYDGKIELNNIARWNEKQQQWFPLVPSSGAVGLNMSDPQYPASVNSFAISGSDLYVGGYFDHANDGTQLNLIAKWDTKLNQWSSLGAGFAWRDGNYTYPTLRALLIAPSLQISQE